MTSFHASPASSRSLLLWATALLAALGSLTVVRASPSFADDALLNRHIGSARFSPNTNKNLDLIQRSPAAAADQDQPDLAVLAPRAATNLQFFRGALANVVAPPITQSNDATRPFAVDGDTFTDFQSAVDRSCDNQHNSCADAANSQKSSSFTVGDCDNQDTQCKAAASSATQTAFVQLASSTAEFDFFCDV